MRFVTVLLVLFLWGCSSSELIRSPMEKASAGSNLTSEGGIPLGEVRYYLNKGDDFENERRKDAYNKMSSECVDGFEIISEFYRSYRIEDKVSEVEVEFFSYYVPDSYLHILFKCK